MSDKELIFAALDNLIDGIEDYPSLPAEGWTENDLKRLRKLRGRHSVHEHYVEEIPGDYYANDKWRSDGAYCVVCDAHLGWYCPKAEKHYCAYNNGDYDNCDFCGMPEERK